MLYCWNVFHAWCKPNSLEIKQSKQAHQTSVSEGNPQVAIASDAKKASTLQHSMNRYQQHYPLAKENFSAHSEHVPRCDCIKEIINNRSTTLAATPPLLRVTVAAIMTLRFYYDCERFFYLHERTIISLNYQRFTRMKKSRDSALSWFRNKLCIVDGAPPPLFRDRVCPLSQLMVPDLNLF